MKTFLSIGSGPGMGLATAERFASEGYTVVLSARDADKTTKLAGELRAKGHRVEIRSVDASNPDDIAKLVADVESQIGPVDVLHYNAAAMRQSTIADQPAATFNSDLAVNIGGALAAAQAAAATMASRGAGTILLTGGGFGVQPHPDYVSLSVGKAGIRAIALGLFESLKEKGIHVGTVTVAAFVNPGSKAAQSVADKFWQLHSQPKGSWTVEEVYAE